MMLRHLAALAAGAMLGWPGSAAAGVPTVEDLPRRDKLTQGHITWHFDEPVPVGQFVNGDYYVVGPVRIVQIGPAPVNPDTGEIENGSVLNLTAPSPSNRDRSSQAFHHKMRHFDKALTSLPPFDMHPGDMLVSSVGTERGVHQCLFGREGNKSWVLSYSILTSLAEPVPADTFRPGYCDHEMKLYRARDLQWWRLHDLEHVQDVPDIERWAGLFRQPWIDVKGFCFGAAAEYQPQYARETARAESFATLLLNLDFPRQQKEPLLINFVQYGIDLWSVVRSEPDFRAWRANGGHGSGRKWAIVFAGMMLGDEAMASPSRTYPQFRFGMDMQTKHGESWTGADVVYAGHLGVYQGEPAGEMVQHLPYEHLQPRDWPIGEFQYPWSDRPRRQYTGELYRRGINSGVWVGIALAGRIMHAQEQYAHDPFFDYVDRWMTEDDAPLRNEIMRQIDADNTAHDFREERFHGQHARDPFVQQMWQRYRDDLPPRRVPPEVQEQEERAEPSP